MKYRNLEKGKEEISLLGFGCMRFPKTEGTKIDRKKAFEMLDYAYKAGVNYYDTAYFYHDGDSEVLLGEWLKTIDRSTVNVVTKSPVFLCKTREDFYRIFDEQREKVGVEYFDFYLLHALDKARFEQSLDFDLFGALDDLKARGLIRKAGFSFHDEYPVFEEILNAYDWDFCQIQLNYMDIEHQAGLKGYHLATEKGIPVIIMEPIKGGLLSDVPEEIREQFDVLHPEWSDSSWAMRWISSFPNVLTVLSGMSTMEHVKDNILTTETFEPMTDEELQVVEAAGELFRKRTKISCTGCNYCMPCPFNVKIPNNFKNYNTAFIYDDVERAKGSYQFMDEKVRANHCMECGVCVDKCPQHIDIPSELKRVSELFQ